MRVKGVLDNEQEITIQRPQSGEKGLQIVTPLFTGVDESGHLKGIFVDRGWLAEEYATLKVHWNGKKQEEVVLEGVIVKGEGKSNTGKNNDEVNKIRIDLEEFVGKTDFANREQAKKLILKEINFNENSQVEVGNAMRKPTPADLCYWYVTPERHQAYSTFWLYATVLNGVANAFLWFYL